MNEALIFLIRTLFGVYIAIVLMRLFLQLVRADFYNPISQFVVKASNPLLVPLRRIIPGFKGVDVAAIVLAYLLSLLEVWLLSGFMFLSTTPLLALMFLVGSVFSLFSMLVLARVILSWVSPGSYNPGSALVHQLTEPVLAPIRRLLPELGGLDLSPMLFLLAVAFLSRLLGIPGSLF